MDPGGRTSKLAIACSVAGIVAMAAVASVPGSPLHPVLPVGVEPGGPFRWLAGVLGIDRLTGGALVAAGIFAILLAAGGFLFLLREAWRGTVSLRAAVILAIAAHAAVLTLPLLVSRDVYSYIAYGTIAALHHANPYVQTPVNFPGDAVAVLVGPKWFATPAVYGPMFTSYAAVVVRAVHGLATQVQVFRVTATVASLATVGVIANTAGREWPGRAAFAVAAFGLNPVVLFQSVGSGHNDLLVALAVAGAFAFVLSGRELPAVAVLTLGALVKATAVLPLLLLITWCVARAPAGRRIRVIASRAGLAAAIGIVVAAPFFQLHDPTLGMLELAGHEGWLAPSRFFRRALDAASGDTLGVIARVTFAAMLVVCVVVLVRAVWRAGAAGGDARGSALELGAAWGWSLLFLMLLGPVLLPWYVTWALPLAWLLPRVPRVVLLGTSVALALSQWAAEPSRFPRAYDLNVLVGHYAITPVVIALMGWLLWDGWRRWRGDLPLHDEESVTRPSRDESDQRRSDAAREV